MKRALRPARMSVLEKLSALEQLWEDLCRSPGAIPSPGWHGKVLSERDEVRKGEARFAHSPRSSGGFARRGREVELLDEAEPVNQPARMTEVAK